MAENDERERLRYLQLKAKAAEVANTPSTTPVPEAPISEAVRTPLGIAKGVANYLNPAAIPGGIERLGRAAVEYATTPKGLGESFATAEKEAIIPTPTISEQAAGLRAAIRTPFSDKTYGALLKEEKASQKEVEGKYFNPTAETAGEIGAGILSLGLLGKDALQAAGVGKKLSNIANQSAYESLKPLGKAADKIVDQGRAQAIGKQLLDDKIVTPGASYKNILSRTNAKLKDYGEQIGFYAKTADKAIASDSSLRGIDVPDLLSNIQNKVIAPLAGDPSTVSAAKQVSDWAVDLKDISQNQDLGFEKAQKLKRSLDAVKAKFGRGGDTILKDAFQDVYRILNDKIEQGIANVFSKAAPDQVNGFEAAKTAYRNLADARAFISKTVARSDKNRFLSLTDYASLFGGGVIGGVTGGPAGAAVGIPAAIANRLIRTKGSQALAGSAKGLSNLLNTQNIPVAQKGVLAGGLVNMLNSGEQ